MTVRFIALTGLALVAAMTTVAAAQSRQPDFRPLNDRQATQSQKGKAQKKACPEYGAGFYRVEGSDTCIRIGGSIDVSVGNGRGVASTPAR